MFLLVFFVYVAGDHRYLHLLSHTFPPRRSSDLGCSLQFYFVILKASQIRSHRAKSRCPSVARAFTVSRLRSTRTGFPMPVLSFDLREIREDRKSTRLNYSN